MSANCRCWCGCEKLDRQLNEETSSDMTCRLCLNDRHLTRHPSEIERIIELEWHVRKMQENLKYPIGDRLAKVSTRLGSDR